MPYDFINPFNFIPLGKKCIRNEEKSNNFYSGVINYSLLTKTPLFIPNTSNDHAILMEEYDNASTENKESGKYHKSYEFFSYEDLSELKRTKMPNDLQLPIIPGSEIRGLIRSNFEIITNSCFSSIDDDGILSKRTSEVFKAAVLKKNANGEFDLYEAEDCLLRTKKSNCLEVDKDWKNDSSHNGRKCYIQDKLKEGQEIFVSINRRNDKCKALVSSISFSDLENLVPGYPIKGEPGPEMLDDKKQPKKEQKHCIHVFIPKNKLICSSVPAERLTKILDVYETNSDGYKEYASQWNLFRKGSLKQAYFPVYYSKATEGNYVMLSPASITRELYEKKLNEIIGEHRVCNEKSGLCPACELFGNINGGLIHASRIRMSDLHLKETVPAEKVYHSPVTLSELSSPKLNNMEFYLNRPEGALFWTYDYYIDAKGKIHNGNAGINGRKFYWHNLKPELTPLIKESIEGKERRYSCRPINKGIIFCGKLYFEKITKTELDRLIFVLNSAESSTSDIYQKKHGYKLGGGKPLGLGSITLNVNEVIVRKVELDIKNRTVINSDVAYEDYVDPVFDQDTLNNFEKMTNMHILEELQQKGYMVDYPRKKDGAEIYGWFTENHKAYKYDRKVNKYQPTKSPNSRTQMVFEEYMEPMNPVMKNTEVKAMLHIDNNGMCGQPESFFNDKRQNKFEKGRGQSKDINDEIRTGVIDDHNPSGKYAKVILDGGGKASFADDGQYPKGTKVALKCEGKEASGFVKWSLVKVIDEK